MVMVIGLFLFAIAAILIGSLLAWLAVHARPASCSFLAAKAVYGGCAGLLVAIATLAFAQLLLSLSKSPLARIAVGLTFALPAGVAGYFAMRRIALAAMPASIWQEMLPMIAAIAIAAASWTRVSRWQ